MQHPLARARDERAERATEPLREADRDRVEARPRSSTAGTPLATAALNSRAPSRWTESSSSRHVSTHRLDLVQRPDASARGVVRVLDRDDRVSARVRRRPVADGRAHLLRRERARCARHRTRHQSRVRRPARRAPRAGCARSPRRSARRRAGPARGSRSRSPSSPSGRRPTPPGRAARLLAARAR